MNTNNLYTVHYTKLFTSGILKGLTHNSSVSFDALRDARRHLAWCNEHSLKDVKPCVGSSAYRITEATIKGGQ